jgi:hypothetical protein
MGVNGFYEASQINVGDAIACVIHVLYINLYFNFVRTVS